MSALRKASMKWPPKHTCISRAYVGEGPNPKTGHKCKLHECEATGEIVAKGDMHADHIDPVVPKEFSEKTRFLGYNWNDIMERMYVEEDKYQAVCKDYHKSKTKKENEHRRKNS